MPVTSVPSSSTFPAVGCSKPAISRKVVVFPQPDGPSSEKNSPLATVRSMVSTATSAKRLVSPTSSICPPAIGCPLTSLPARRPRAARPGRPPGTPRWAKAPARRPGEAELRGGEPHAQLEGAGRVHHRVGQGDLHRQPVQERGEQHREVQRVDRAE